MTGDYGVIPAPEARDPLAALAAFWEDEAAQMLPTLTGNASARTLRSCAQQLREAIAKGAAS